MRGIHLRFTDGSYYPIICTASFRRIGDTDFALRWRLIEMCFSKSILNNEWRSETRKRRGERGIWQRRHWEHSIRDEKDFAAHMGYVHINPVKHGLVARVPLRRRVSYDPQISAASRSGREAQLYDRVDF